MYEIKNAPAIHQDRLDYSISLQFLFMNVACLLVIWTGVSTVAVVTCLALYVVRMFAITAGFHRLLAHRTYRTSRLFQFLIAFTGTASYQKGPLWWSAHHRRHHLVADTEMDFHSPLTRKFWRAHFGWFLSRDSQQTEWKLITNLSKYPELRFLDRYYHLPPLVLAVAVFLLGFVLERYAPGLGTSRWQMLVWAFFISTVTLYHGTFTVNSLAHIFGKRRFTTGDNSRNNLFVALITLGEGWHNNHHHYPSSERQGIYWWEIDVSHYTLRALSWLGIVWDLNTHPANLASRAGLSAASETMEPAANIGALISD
ncbi:MAG TPA: acyl-CoA desaturase [Pyrinomonadaceae bacterium]|jgi:stearoyl-CoA desaturase (Delta-9 desaturase)